MSRYGRVWLLLAALGTFLQGQQSSIELAAGWASPSSDLTQYARPGAFLELHVGDAPLPARWDWRVRFQVASYQPQQVTEAHFTDLATYDRRTASFTAAFECLTPALTPGSMRLRGLVGLGLEAWRLTEMETYHYSDGVTPDQRTDNGYGDYLGYQAALGLRLEYTRQAHAEVRVEASKVAFVGVFKDREFNAPVRLTTSVGWRF